MAFRRLVTALLVILAPIAAAAQSRPLDASGPVDLSPAAPGRFEAGASGAMLLIFPGFGGFVSIPAGRAVSVEVGAETYPWFYEDGDNARFLTQAQVRIPFRIRDRAFRSVLLGVSVATVGDSFETSTGGTRWEFQTDVFPHAGISWQWRRGEHVDLRLDVQALVSLRAAPIAAPRVAFSTVWHRKGGRQ